MPENLDSCVKKLVAKGHTKASAIKICQKSTGQSCKESTRSQTIREVVESSNIRVDPKAGIIYGVRVLGAKSRNGRRYTPEAIANAVGLYEGTVVHFDHPPRHDPERERSISDQAGWLQDVKESNDGLSADFHVLTKDPRTPKVFEAADRNPKIFGLSHNVAAETRRENGETIVEEITRVRSVDLVDDPATTRSLFESMEDNMSRTIADIIEAGDAKNRGIKLLREMIEDDTLAPETPVDVPEEANADEQIKVALHTAAKAAVDDDSLDPAATGEKVTKILAAEEELVRGGEAETEEKETKEPAVESAKLLRKVLKGQQEIQEQMTALKGQVGKETIRGGQRVLESGGNGDKEPPAQNAKDFCERFVR